MKENNPRRIRAYWKHWREIIRQFSGCTDMGVDLGDSDTIPSALANALHELSVVDRQEGWWRNDVSHRGKSSPT